MDLKNQILVALGIEKTINLEWQSKLEDGTIVVSTSETLESGVDVSVLTEDGTTIPLPTGTYKTEDGVSFRVEEEGIVSEVMESETEEVVEAAEDECPNGYDDDGNCKEDEKTEAADVEDWEGLEKRIQNLEDAVAKLKEDKVGGDTEMADEEDTAEVVEEVVEVVEASIEEIATAIDEATPDAVTPELAQQAAEIAVEVLQEKAEEVVDEATELENKKAKTKATLAKLKEENKKLKTQLAESPADAPINTNKFSSERPELTKKQYNKLSKQERFLYNLNN
tara:strand:+ start:8683 stop:9525 length:843 start_codon:yes stop_codon:yes gene_type:complete